MRLEISDIWKLQKSYYNIPHRFSYTMIYTAIGMKTLEDQLHNRLLRHEDTTDMDGSEKLSVTEGIHELKTS